LRLHVIGSSPALPRPGGACSSYLVRTDEALVVLDLGVGAFSKLQLAVEYARLDAIVISHMHADHYFDVVPAYYTLKYGEVRLDRRLPLWLPPGGGAALEALRRAASADEYEDFFESVFTVREYDPAKPLAIKDLRLHFARTRHFIEAYAVRAESGDASITYSADTAPCETVVELARETRLFLCETALGLAVEKGGRGHCSAAEAGEMAAQARAGRLLLTHYPAAYAAAQLVDAAKARFDGPVEAAEDGLATAV